MRRLWGSVKSTYVSNQNNATDTGSVIAYTMRDLEFALYNFNE